VQNAQDVIARLNLTQPLQQQSPSWPPQAEDGTSLFVGRPPFRKLSVLADATVIDDFDASQFTPGLILAGLLTHDFIECFRYSDTGPPPEIPRKQIEPIGEVVPGWAVVSPPDIAYGVRDIRVSDGIRTKDTGIMGDAIKVAARDVATPVYADMEPNAAAQRRTRDAIAAQTAENIGSDLFLTNRPYLRSVRWSLARGVTPLLQAEALPFVSLYLRAQGQFIIFRSTDGRSTHTINRGLFYWVGTRELLPAAWRWFNACVQHSIAQNDDSLLLLGQSVLMRVTRALQERDKVHVALNQPQNNDVADGALSALDVCLLLLMGAVDASARVVHRILRLSGNAHSAAWQHDQWLQKVLTAAPAFARIIGAGTTGRHALTILTTLRNSVHGEALQPLAVRNERDPLRTAVGIPARDEPVLLAAVAALGGELAWGIEQVIPGRFHADPGILLERLFPLLLDLMNSIMEATPVEKLSGVALGPSHRDPPHGPPFDERARLSIRWQLGF
jgi:hypothetical protein